jgi:hypothetical protein
MRMLKAIARVRRGAQDKGLEGALSSLGNELRSDAIPERLRDAAARLATLLSPKATGAPVVALEQALAARDLQKSAGEALGHAQASVAAEPERTSILGSSAEARTSTRGADHTGPGVCPFTGMRADGTLAVAPTSPVGANDPTLELSPLPAKAAHEPKAEVRASVHEPRVESAVRAPKARAPKAREVEVRASAHEPKKDKEKLAGARIVENTSARSATRSAPKQPRSRTQRNRKKV